MRCIWWNVINVCWNDVVVLDWDGMMHVCLHNRRLVSAWLSLGSVCSVRYGMKVFNHQICKSGKPRKTCKCALCTVDDMCCFHDIRLGPKTSVYKKHVSVKSIVTSCDVTNCARTLQGFTKQNHRE